MLHHSFLDSMQEAVGVNGPGHLYSLSSAAVELADN
jgi:hypothetical protein